LIHCSGGAQTKILNFIEDIHVIKDNLFPVPPLFKIIQEQSGTLWQEMYKVFNMGHRFEVYLPADQADRVMEIASGFDIEARIVGRCEKSVGKKLTIKSEYGDFFY
jgi:phosphoribosylformylglycinamidine cyclo-ligase